MQLVEDRPRDQLIIWRLPLLAYVSLCFSFQVMKKRAKNECFPIFHRNEVDFAKRVSDYMKIRS